MTIIFLMATQKVAEGQHDAIVVRELTNQEFERLQTALSLAGHFNESHILYEICQANEIQIDEFYYKIGATNGFNFADSHSVIVELNRLLLNYLSSFRTFIDHQETLLKRISTPENNWIAHFKKRTNELYDNSFSYRFLWHLRNYVQHCGLPIGGMTTRTRRKDDGMEEPVLTIYFDRDDLLNNYREWKKPIQEELARQTEHIEIIDHINNLRVCIRELALSAMEIHIHRLSEHWTFLVELINEVTRKYEGCVPIIGHFKKTDNKYQPVLLSALSMPLILKIQQVWDDFDSEYNK